MQALFVDSKTERKEAAGTATIQTTQTSMKIRQKRSGSKVEEQGSLPVVVARSGDSLLTTTIFVKYNYQEMAGPNYELVSITVACLPNGMLQDRYNPDANDTFWLVGRNAPSRGEPFRARIGFQRLKNKTNWRVQHIYLRPEPSHTWDD